MATAPMTTANTAAAIDKGIRKHFVDDYKQKPPKVEKLLQIGKQEDYNQEHQNYSGAGSMSAIAEGSRYPTNVLLQTYSTTITPVKYGDTIEITDRQMRYDKALLGRSSTIGQAQSRQVRNSIERRAASLFVNGFSTSNTSYGDNKPLFSVDHTRADGGTANSNASASGIALSHDNLETGVQSLREQLDDRGQFIEARPSYLVVPPALEGEALAITGSRQESGTGDNDDNTFGMKEYHGGKMKVCVWDYLGSVAGGSDTAWFLLDKETHKIMWLWGLKPEVARVDENTGNLNDTYFWKTRYEAGIGWTDYRGAWGSKGDGQAYSS